MPIRPSGKNNNNDGKVPSSGRLWGPTSLLIHGQLRPYKTTVIDDLQPRVPAGRVHFSSCFLQSVVGGEIDPQLTFFSDEACFTCRDTYIRKGKNFLSFRTLSAVRHADSSEKIRMRLAASGAPAAVKRRAVVPVNKVKILPVELTSLDVSHERIGSHRKAANLPFRTRVCSSVTKQISE
jgi:hypothetical protein